MLDREKVEGEYYRVCPKFGVGLTVYSPLKQGILTGKYNDSPSAPPSGTRFSERQDRAKKEKYGSNEWLQNIQQVKQVQPIADKLGVPMATLAAAWCLKNDNVATIVTGASRPQQVVSNVDCLKLLPKLTDDVMEEIDAALENKPTVEPPRFGGH
ncbi:hypothetical protein KEM55_003250 [Ascosphaera atra]|nr:hypothetical protein KEM55_003250 [Ascosphaera atra]